MAPWGVGLSGYFGRYLYLQMQHEAIRAASSEHRPSDCPEPSRSEGCTMAKRYFHDKQKQSFRDEMRRPKWDTTRSKTFMANCAIISVSRKQHSLHDAPKLLHVELAWCCS